MTYEETQKWLESANVCKNCKHALRRSNFTGGYNWCGWECLTSKKLDDYKRLDESCEKFEKRSTTETRESISAKDAFAELENKQH